MTLESLEFFRILKCQPVGPCGVLQWHSDVFGLQHCICFPWLDGAGPPVGPAWPQTGK